MEIAIHPSMPTYSGGLGVLAGDTLRSAADLGIPLVAFTLLHRKGYFQQHLDSTGKQTEEVQPWNPADFCTEEPARITVSVEERTVTVRAWRYNLEGRSGHIVPIYLLDTDLEGNSGWDRGLTDHLYGGDTNYRLQQEIVLGMGGVRMANALGLHVNVYHMNEGHAALLTLALLESQVGGGPLGAATESDLAVVRNKCVFTTHTPVPAGHDRFSNEQAFASWAASAPAPAEAQLLPRGPAQHDPAGAALLALCQRRRPAAWQGLARHVPRVPDRLHHQRRACAHVGFGADTANAGCAYSRHGAATICTCAMPSTCRKRRS